MTDYQIKTRNKHRQRPRLQIYKFATQGGVNKQTGDKIHQTATETGHREQTRRHDWRSRLSPVEMTDKWDKDRHVNIACQSKAGNNRTRKQKCRLDTEKKVNKYWAGDQTQTDRETNTEAKLTRRDETKIDKRELTKSNKEFRTRNINTKTQVLGKLNTILDSQELENQLVFKTPRVWIPSP